MSSTRNDSDQQINQRIFETSLDLILVVSRRGDIIRVSPSANHILGFHPAEMVGQSAKSFLYVEDLDTTREEMRLARRGRETRNFDCRYVHKDGRVVPLAWTGVWSEAEGQHFFIGRDMTERLEIEERQRRSQRLEAIGQLTGGIAHDFNNLLTVIVGNLELIEMQLEEGSRELRRVNAAKRAALRGATLTAQLLAFARQQPLNAQTFDMNDNVAETLRMLRRTLGEGIDIRTRQAEDLWPTYADQTQFESALVNLALNARDAMPDGGELLVETANATVDDDLAGYELDVPPGLYVVLSVSDTGTGMPPEIRSRVFEPFFTTKAPGKGTGMGLSMVFGFAKQSEGGVKIYSEVGLGTTVRLYLPRATDTLKSGDKAVRVEAAPARPGECVLVAEDNPDVRAVVVAQLEELGYRVLETADGRQALSVLELDEAIDLLFSDVVMAGGMSGIDLARAARTVRPGMKVLLTSGFALATMGKAAAEDEGWPLLTKPYRKIDLATRIREILDG